MQTTAETASRDVRSTTPCAIDDSSSHNRLVRILPEWLKHHLRYWKQVWELFRGAFYDFQRCRRFSGMLTAVSQKSSHEALLTLHYHIIEKGLSLAAPRPGFGRPVVNALLGELASYVHAHGSDRIAVTTLSVLCAYRDFNRENGIHDENLDRRLQALSKMIPELPDDTIAGGVIQVYHDDILNSSQASFRELTMTRHSVRSFTGEPVPRELIEEAVRISVKTPSACNRQPWRAHCYSEPEDRKRILAEQGGNRGFGDSAGAVLIVTADLGAFLTTTERNEPYVDGGMFAMSLVYALHSLGLGTCCLHLCLGASDDRSFHRIAEIDECEVFIMMIAVGKLPHKLRVAKSCRKPLPEILKMHSRENRHVGRKSDDAEQLKSLNATG